MAFDIKTLGGLSTGALGDITNPTGQINSYGSVSAISTDGYRLTLGYTSIGAFEAFSAGNKVLFHVSGCLSTATADKDKFLVATIIGRSGADIVLDKSVATVFTPANLSSYCCQVVTIPQFNSLTLSAGKSVSALGWDTTNKIGGILIVSTKGTADITGASLLAQGKGFPGDYYGASTFKPKGITYTNNDLKTRIPLNIGNGIVIGIGASLTGSAATRIGASWTGNALGGCAGVGYPSCYDSSYSSSGTAGSAGASGGGDGGCGPLTGNASMYTAHGGYSGGAAWGAQTGGLGGATVALAYNSINGFCSDMISTGGGAPTLQTYTWIGTPPGNGGAGCGAGGAGWAAGGGGGYALVATNTEISVNATAYALDTLSLDKSGLLMSNQSLDCTALTSVDGFSIDGQQPSSSNRRIIFSTNSAVVLGSRTFPITTNAVAADTVTICGVTFTAIESGATGNQFNVGTTAALTAANLAATMNANATFNALYTATASDVTITVTEKVAKGNNPAAATKTGTIVIGTGTVVTSVPKWYKLTIASGAATLTPVATQTPTISSVLVEGNTVDELLTVTSVAAFVGKMVYPAIALMAPCDATEFPTIKLSINGKSITDVYEQIIESQEFAISSNGDIPVSSFFIGSTVSNGGAVTGLVSLKQNGTWSSWLTVSEANTNKSASAVKFKATLSGTTIGSSTAKLNYFSFVYANTHQLIANAMATNVITETKDFGGDIRQAKLIIKHAPLIDSTISAKVALRNPATQVSLEAIGVGTGTYQTFPLANKNGVVPKSIKIFYGATPSYIFDYNTSTGQVGCTAPAGTNVFASYQYGLGNEDWVDMVAGSTISGSVEDTSEFLATLPVDTREITAFQLSLNRVKSSVIKEPLGIANGITQQFVLKHIAVPGTIAVYANGAYITSFSYDHYSKIITVAAPAGAALTVDYQWVSEAHKVNSIVALCSE